MAVNEGLHCHDDSIQRQTPSSTNIVQGSGHGGNENMQHPKEPKQVSRNSLDLDTDLQLDSGFNAEPWRRILWKKQPGYSDNHVPNDFLKDVRIHRERGKTRIDQNDSKTSMNGDPDPNPTHFSNLILHQSPNQTIYTSFICIFLSVFRRLLRRAITPNQLLIFCLGVVLVGWGIVLGDVWRMRRRTATGMGTVRTRTLGRRQTDACRGNGMGTLLSIRSSSRKATPKQITKSSTISIPKPRADDQATTLSLPTTTTITSQPSASLSPPFSLVGLYNFLHTRSPTSTTLLLPPISLYILSPLLINLTKATTDDTIWPLSTALFGVSALLGGFEDRRSVAVLTRRRHKLKRRNNSNDDNENDGRKNEENKAESWDSIDSVHESGTTRVSTRKIRKMSVSSLKPLLSSGVHSGPKYDDDDIFINNNNNNKPKNNGNRSRGSNPNANSNSHSKLNSALSIIPEMTGLNNSENLQSCLSQTCTLSACIVISSRLRTSTEVFSLLVFVGMLMGALIWLGRAPVQLMRRPQSPSKWQRERQRQWQEGNQKMVDGGKKRREGVFLSRRARWRWGLGWKTSAAIVLQIISFSLILLDSYTPAAPTTTATSTSTPTSTFLSLSSSQAQAHARAHAHAHAHANTDTDTFFQKALSRPEGILLLGNLTWCVFGPGLVKRAANRWRER